MKTVIVESLGSPPVVRDDLPEPEAGPGQVLVRVRASSVNPVDNAIAVGMLKDMIEHDFPITLGRDYAGTVEAIGDGVTGFAAGDAVFGFIPGMAATVHDGAWSELLVVPEEMSIAPIPAGIDPAAAGAVPLAAVTAFECVDALELSDGDTVLIVGAPGGVGSFAVQLAAAAGATVIAPALPEDEDYLRDLGVSEIVPRDGDVAAAVRQLHPDGVDALVDMVSYAPGDYDAALKDGGRVSSPTNAAGDGPGRTNVMSAPTRENLDRVARLLADGTLKVPVKNAYALDQAPEALQALATGHTQGKLAIRLD
jgi:NADPH:quinone reductase